MDLGAEAPAPDVIQAGSPFFLFYIYQLWAKRGLPAMLDDIRARWTGMMRCDCTTCWEVFPGFYEVGRTRSYCHSWSASPAYFFGRWVLGVHPLAAGFAKVELRHGEAGLAWCEGTVPTPHGNLDVRWSTENGRRTCHVTAPRAIEIMPPDDSWELEVARLEQA